MERIMATMYFTESKFSKVQQFFHDVQQPFDFMFDEQTRLYEASFKPMMIHETALQYMLMLQTLQRYSYWWDHEH